MSVSPDDAYRALLHIHDQIDARARALGARHEARLKCERGCHDCCVDDLTVFAVEAERIRRNHADLLATQAPGPTSGCAFLDREGACRVYADRPYVCRTQGLPLRWQDDGVEHRDICPLNAEGEPIETLPVDACWPIGPVEERLAGLDLIFSGGASERVALRTLFESASPGV